MNLVIEPTGEIGNVISSRESVLMWPSCWPLAHAFMRRGERAHTKGPVGRCNNNSRRSEGLHSVAVGWSEVTQPLPLKHLTRFAVHSEMGQKVDVLCVSLAIDHAMQA